MRHRYPLELCAVAAVVARRRPFGSGGAAFHSPRIVGFRRSVVGVEDQGKKNRTTDRGLRKSPQFLSTAKRLLVVFWERWYMMRDRDVTHA
jgi:hypothetical protein